MHNSSKAGPIAARRPPPSALARRRRLSLVVPPSHLNSRRSAERAYAPLTILTCVQLLFRSTSASCMEPCPKSARCRIPCLRRENHHHSVSACALPSRSMTLRSHSAAVSSLGIRTHSCLGLSRPRLRPPIAWYSSSVTPNVDSAAVVCFTSTPLLRSTRLWVKDPTFRRIYSHYSVLSLAL